MNLTIKSMILDIILSIILTLAGGGNFYSFLFFFILLLLPSILIFVSLDIAGNSSKKLPKNDTRRKKELE